MVGKGSILFYVINNIDEIKYHELILQCNTTTTVLLLSLVKNPCKTDK